MDSFPINFEALAKSGGNPAAGGYPYQIKGSDLMRNFVHAALDVEDGLVENLVAQGGYAQRKLRVRPGTGNNQIAYWDGENYVPLASPPGGGTFVLGAVGGQIQWIETEECT